MRLFVAIFPDAEVIEHVSAFADGLAIGRAAAGGVNTRRLAPDMLHVTLAFIGEVPDKKRAGAELATAEAAAVLAPAGLRLRGGGSFGPVLWTGVSGPVGAPAVAIRRALTRHRVPYDQRKFRPHLTLGRPGDRIPLADFEDDVERLGGYESPEWTVGSLELVGSVTGPQTRYEILGSWPFGRTG
ncbi:RNA 2',3'-cyclic phosphodiesterase [Longispora albida]|uniref:RNA 2',3'-cyclic phosphodiesterase n=1 Tax=Longispora albida TaxID=203523 RepID=UPI000377B4D8|nr:RNA 2',3'-cyclic phosphodiesterase [Longispora albida]